MTGLFLALMIASGEPSKHERCLAKVIHYESRGESFKGKVATRDVVKNRMRKSGKTCKEVVYEKRQFSWTATPHKKIVKKRYKTVMRAKPVLGEGYLWFFRHDIARPVWSKNLRCDKRVDKHLYCRV